MLSFTLYPTHYTIYTFMICKDWKIITLTSQIVALIRKNSELTPIKHHETLQTIYVFENMTLTIGSYLPSST